MEAGVLDGEFHPSDQRRITDQDFKGNIQRVRNPFCHSESFP